MISEAHIAHLGQSSGLQLNPHIHSTSLPDADAVRGVKDTKEQAYQIARQFESLLIEEVIKSARVAGGGWLGDDADSTSENVAEMGEQFLARSLASAGGLGLAAQFAPVIHRDLNHAAAAQSTSAPTGSSSR